MAYPSTELGSSVILESPKAREKSEELKARLSKLQDLADQKVYNELVRDVTRHSRDKDPVYFSSYRDQFGFGLHVMLIMFTAYIFGYTVFRSQFKDNPALHAAGGVIGLLLACLRRLYFLLYGRLLPRKPQRTPHLR